MMKRPSLIAATTLLAMVLCLPGRLPAQNLSTSPYSRFGIGDLLYRSTGRSQAMGGLSCGLRSGTSLNLLNPASLSGIDTLNFLFDIAGFEKVTWLATTDLNKVANNLGVSYLALGFPVTKWWKASIGVMPLSNVGYKMTSIEVNPIMDTVQYQFSGTGGISNFFMSSSISPIKYLSLGATFSYLFGPITHSRVLEIPADSNYFSTKAVQTAIVGDINLSYGAQVHIPFKDNWFLTTGGIFQNTANLNTTSRTTLITYGSGLTDTLLYSENPKNSIILPMGWGAGFSFGKANKFTAGFDYRTQDWSKAEFLGQRDSMANSRDFIGGIEFIPNQYSIKRYLDRVRYRAGFRYSETYLQIKGTQLTDMCLSIGAGFPILDRVRRLTKSTQSSFNVSLELGRRGTVENNLIRETYGTLTLQLTLHDYWFVKPKYD